MIRSKRGIFVVVVMGLLVAGCTHTRYNNVNTEVEEDALPPATPGTVHELQSFRKTDPEPPPVVVEELEAIPVEINAKVEQWLNYFQRKGRPYMERYLARSGRYSILMKRILRQNGLPEDLLYIALIESGFSSKITSRAAAVGYWQFIRGTGRRYKLEINPLVDERRDFVLSTQAAADYFKGLYSLFGSWYLAMASYNVGENRVRREVTRYKTRDFWELVRLRRLPKETMNYVPKYIAAKLIAKNPEKYGFTEIEYEDPIEFELIRVDKPLNLRVMAEKMGLDYDEFKRLNPKFRGEIAPTKENGVLELRVPLKSTEQALVAAREAVVDKVDFVASAGETETYRVKSGDSLYTIARRFKTTVAWLRDVNDIKPKKRLRIGMRIQVPDRSTPKRPAPKVVAKAPKPAPAPEKVAQVEDSAQAEKTEVETSQGLFYIVQPGDNLSSIAEEYDSSVKELLKMNKIRRGSLLRVGMKLKVPKDDPLPNEPGAENQPNGSVKGPGSQPQDLDREPGNSEPQPGSSLRNSRASQFADIAQKAYRPQQSAPKRNSRVAPPQRVAQASGSQRGQIRSRGGKQRVHVVRAGENLTAIALRYRTSTERLAAHNRLRDSDNVLTGSRLIIPR